MQQLADLSDSDLVERAQRAISTDTRPFDELVRRHTRRVQANCRAITRSTADVEDLAQDVFVKAFFALRRFEQRAKFSTWLNRIKINHCLNFLQKRAGKHYVDIDDTPLASDDRTDQPLERRAMRAQIQKTLDALPDILRIPLIMRDLDHFSYQEIADELGVGLSAAKMRIKRGREQFRALYGDGPGR